MAKSVATNQFVIMEEDHEGTIILIMVLKINFNDHGKVHGDSFVCVI